MFHALCSFIFKRQFWQNIMSYGSSEYCAWLSVIYLGNVLYDRGFLGDLNPMKVGKSRLGSWIQGSWILTRSFTFFTKIWWAEGQKWVGRGRGIGIYAISYKRNKSCIFLILVRIWIQRKGWLGSWHMCGIGAGLCFNLPFVPFVSLCRTISYTVSYLVDIQWYFIEIRWEKERSLVPRRWALAFWAIPGRAVSCLD